MLKRCVVASLMILASVTSFAGALGVGLQEVTPELAEAMGIPEEGILVRGVSQGSPAEKGDLRRGDIILELNGKKVRDLKSFVRDVRDVPEGKSVALTVWRDGETFFVGIRLGPNPSAREDENENGDDRERHERKPPEREPTDRDQGDRNPRGREPADTDSGDSDSEDGDWRWPKSKPTPSSRNRQDDEERDEPKEAEDPDNLLRNGGFESGLGASWGTGAWSQGKIWRNVDGNRATGDASFDRAHNGEMSLRVHHLSELREGWVGGTSQRLGQLEAGKRYRLAAWAMGEKVTASAVKLRVVVRETGSPVAELEVPDGTFEWKKLQAEFEAPAEALDLEILSVDRALVYLDDLSVKPVP